MKETINLSKSGRGRIIIFDRKVGLNAHHLVIYSWVKMGRDDSLPSALRGHLLSPLAQHKPRRRCSLKCPIWIHSVGFFHKRNAFGLESSGPIFAWKHFDFLFLYEFHLAKYRNENKNYNCINPVLEFRNNPGNYLRQSPLFSNPDTLKWLWHRAWPNPLQSPTQSLVWHKNLLVNQGINFMKRCDSKLIISVPVLAPVTMATLSSSRRLLVQNLRLSFKYNLTATIANRMNVRVVNVIWSVFIVVVEEEWFIVISSHAVLTLQLKFGYAPLRSWCLKLIGKFFITCRMFD